jgi:hypothetical protein
MVYEAWSKDKARNLKKNKKYWGKLREGGHKQKNLISLLDTPRTAYETKKLGGHRKTNRKAITVPPSKNYGDTQMIL